MRKVVISITIIVIIAGCFYIIKIKTEYSKGGNAEVKQTGKVNIESYRYISSQAIDSILYTFGVKKEWITTHSKNERKQGDKFLWYAKDAEIPKSLNTTKVNLELTNYLRNVGLNPVVTEDIRSKNITFNVYADSSNSNSPLVKIFINHEGKPKVKGER